MRLKDARLLIRQVKALNMPIPIVDDPLYKIFIEYSKQVPVLIDMGTNGTTAWQTRKDQYRFLFGVDDTALHTPFMNEEKAIHRLRTQFENKVAGGGKKKKQ